VNLESLIQTRGYAAVFLGGGLEGETAACLGGVAAHRYLLDYSRVGLCGLVLRRSALFPARGAFERECFGRKDQKV
jgi:hypothetical protein